MDKLAVIKKFIENRCSAEEAELAYSLLEKEPALLDEAMGLEDFIIQPDIPVHPVIEEQIRKNVFRATIHKPYVIIRRIISAAAVLAGLFFITQYLIQPASTPQVHSNLFETQKNTIENQLVIHSNKGSAIQIIQLEDQSEVELYPGSVIRYEQSFSENRKIHLEGIAVFNVKKNTASPFTVYTGSVSTTALGTKFLVKNIEGAGSVNIQLYEGKVVVEPSGNKLSFARTFLSPGQQCFVDLMLSIVEVNNLPEVNSIAHKNNALHKDQPSVEVSDKLVFTKAPLALVLDSLQKIYKTVIEFNTHDIAESNFTGVLSLNDPLDISLKAIASMQGYEISDLGTGFQFILKDPEVQPEASPIVKLEKNNTLHHSFPSIEFKPDYVYKFLLEEKPVIEITESGYRYNNIALSSLFELLNKESGFEIVFDSNEIDGMNFSGTIDYRQSVNNILSVICLVNDLEYTQKKRKYIISRKAKD